jgi:DNA repair protein RecO (recombination protein O)
MNQVTEKAIILKTIKHMDSNLIVHAINTKGAKLNLFAKAAARSKKRFGGAVLEPLNFVQLVYKPAKSEGDDQLGQLQEATFVSGFPKIRTDYDRLELAFYFVKLILKLSQPDALDNDALFNLFGHALKNLETSSDLRKLKLQFELKLLALQGVLPHLESSEDLLKTPLARHSEVQLESESLLRLQSAVRYVLSEYTEISN